MGSGLRGSVLDEGSKVFAMKPPPKKSGRFVTYGDFGTCYASSTGRF